MLMFVIMNMAVVMNMPGIGAVGLRVVHSAQDARKTLLRHLNQSAPSAPATSSLLRQASVMSGSLKAAGASLSAVSRDAPTQSAYSSRNRQARDVGEAERGLSDGDR